MFGARKIHGISSLGEELIVLGEIELTAKNGGRP